jgi:hypothetical protein
MPSTACRMLFVCGTLRVVRCIFPIAHCLWRGVCCTFSGGAVHVVSCVSSVALLFVGSCRLHAPVPRCRVVCAVCRLVPRRVSSRCMFCVSSVAYCMTPVPSRILSFVRRLSPVPSCMPSGGCCKTRVLCCFLSLVHADPILACHLLPASSVATLQSDTAPSNTQRIAAALAIERLSGRQDPLQTEVCMRACVRACVRACAWVASVRCVVVGCCACAGSICATAIK